ncbi:hypothetical protein [Actinoplanes regularis]|uniref:Uncharacterized protein n=1 Tax=Actinoplanes regularis TaxID=52697 RepID=A0A239A3T2_9ACTN|nr:hypothetical protein [Actinoplanes regularis]GIE87128.1 hypothetical protein Are01nite_36080 [Actinoplanes regularis]GLW28239.1 hypothetical protein Areg01_11790 [Actinoplanes regularis]SNR89961.1 hypothetical protein SAMN06264365_10733 [Actinoplanes regularis]
MSRYEIHLTVSAEADDERLRSLAADRGVKYTRIQLDRGEHASQPMLSWLSDGTPASAEADARRTASALRSEGFPVSRLKVEAAASGSEAPVTAEQAAEQPDLYFEHHVKLLLPASTDLDRVRAMAVEHGARLSRNARRVRADGVQERFITQRCYQVERSEAAATLAGLLGAVAGAGWEVAEVEQEWVLVDDNPALDAGWFE